MSLATQAPTSMASELKAIKNTAVGPVPGSQISRVSTLKGMSDLIFAVPVQHRSSGTQ